jgi:hypothetical protein
MDKLTDLAFELRLTGWGAAMAADAPLWWHYVLYPDL